MAVAPSRPQHYRTLPWMNVKPQLSPVSDTHRTPTTTRDAHVSSLRFVIANVDVTALEAIVLPAEFDDPADAEWLSLDPSTTEVTLTWHLNRMSVLEVPSSFSQPIVSRRLSVLAANFFTGGMSRRRLCADCSSSTLNTPR